MYIESKMTLTINLDLSSNLTLIFRYYIVLGEEFNTTDFGSLRSVRQNKHALLCLTLPRSRHGYWAWRSTAGGSPAMA